MSSLDLIGRIAESIENGERVLYDKDGMKIVEVSNLEAFRVYFPDGDRSDFPVFLIFKNGNHVGTLDEKRVYNSKRLNDGLAGLAALFKGMK